MTYRLVDAAGTDATIGASYTDFRGERHTLEGSQARWTAWAEGPSGYERRQAAEADQAADEDQPTEARP